MLYMIFKKWSSARKLRSRAIYNSFDWLFSITSRLPYVSSLIPVRVRDVTRRFSTPHDDTSTLPLTKSTKYSTHDLT